MRASGEASPQAAGSPGSGGDGGEPRVEPGVERLDSDGHGGELDEAGQLDEATLVGRAQDGDPVAFERLFDCYQARLFRHVYRMVADRAVAEDVVQDSFIAAWQYLPSLLQPAAFRGWLYQIATRRSLDHLRTRREHLPLDEQSDAVGPSVRTGGAKDPASVHEQQAQLESLQQILSGLPTLQRMIWSMREIDGLSYEEIARATRLPVGTVRGRIARTRRQVVEGMSPWR